MARLNGLLNEPKGFTIEELYKIGELCGLSEREIYMLSDIHYQHIEEKKRKKIEDVKDLIKKLE